MVDNKQQNADSNLKSETNTSHTNQSQAEPAQATNHPPIPPTFASHLGEMVWLLSQSATHRHLSIADLEWVLMPPLILGQYKLYHKSNNPTALALWAYLTKEDEQRLLTVNKLRPEAWCAGDAQRLLSPAHSDHTPMSTTTDNDAQLWLIELIAPSATADNKLNESVLADLMNTAFNGQGFKLHIANPQTGKREVQVIDNL